MCWLSFSIPFHSISSIAFHSTLLYCTLFHSILDLIPFHTELHSILGFIPFHYTTFQSIAATFHLAIPVFIPFSTPCHFTTIHCVYLPHLALYLLHNISFLLLRPNDAPYGLFGLSSPLVSLSIPGGIITRTLDFTITRMMGSVGTVVVQVTSTYDPVSLLTYQWLIPRP